MCKAIAWPDSAKVRALAVALGTLLAAVEARAPALPGVGAGRLGRAAALVAVHLGRVLKPIVQDARAEGISQRHLPPLGVNFNDRELLAQQPGHFFIQVGVFQEHLLPGEERAAVRLLPSSGHQGEGGRVWEIHCSLPYPFDSQHQLTTGVQ